MQVMWEADDWLMVRDIRDRLAYPPVAYTTVAKVTSILHGKDLLIRRLEDRAGKPGPLAWWYRAARPVNEHIGELIATLMGYSPDPEAALAYALAARRRTEEAGRARITDGRPQPRPRVRGAALSVSGTFPGPQATTGTSGR